MPAPLGQGDDRSGYDNYLPPSNSSGVLGALAVQVLVRDLEAQALDLAPAPVLAPTRALAPPALLETEDQALDLRPRPLLGRV